MVTTVLRVDFQAHTSYDEIFQELLGIGLHMTVAGYIDTYGPDGQFIILGGTWGGCFALVRLSMINENRARVMRDLRLVPKSTQVRELDTRGA